MQRTLTIDIDATADAVWHILAHRYCEVADWTDAVKRSWPMTADMVPDDVTVAPAAPFPGRMVVTPLGQLAEVLIDWDEEARSFTFVALGVPGIVTRSTDKTTVTPTGPASCRVSLDVEMELWGPLSLLDPVLKRSISSVLIPFLEDLKRTAETPASSGAGTVGMAGALPA